MGRIAVLASGSGTNLQALLDDPFIRPRIGVVLTDRVEIEALDRAVKAGVPAEAVDRRNYASRTSFDAALMERIRAYGADIVLCAGFMRILGPEFVHAFPNAILNVHPSLLPAFPGAHAVREALAWKTAVTGCTVHFVDEEVDHGPAILQEAVPVLPDDDEESLHQRIKQVEHRLFPMAVRLLLAGRLVVEGRTVRILEEAEAPN
ncbi:MAG: phosphoribosylglycinamide formyltransferase [Actinobacteria bacterium]|nr:phosphoribosylglycinamide formyltransferase [Actinomycetota bacterium]